MYKIIEWFLTLVLTFLASTNNGQSTSITITRGLPEERGSERTEGLECDMKTQRKSRAGYCQCRSNRNTFYDDNERCQSLEEIGEREGNMRLF